MIDSNGHFLLVCSKRFKIGGRLFGKRTIVVHEMNCIIVVITTIYSNGWEDRVTETASASGIDSFKIRLYSAQPIQSSQFSVRTAQRWVSYKFRLGITNNFSMKIYLILPTLSNGGNLRSKFDSRPLQNQIFLTYRHRLFTTMCLQIF